MTPPGNMSDKQQVFQAFFAFWIVLGVSSFLFFQLNRDSKLKKRVLPFFVVGVGVIFGTFAAWMSNWQPFVLAFFIPMVALITFLNLRTIKFCPSCGRTLYRQPVFAKASFCSHCGSSLEEKKEPNQAPEPTAPSGRGSS
jgi:hypothetical protein